MKFLENAKLELLSSVLSVDTNDCRLDARVESYSCKMVQEDKRRWKEHLQAGGPSTSPSDPQALSPPVIDDPWAFPYSQAQQQPPSPNVQYLNVMRQRHRSRSTSGSDQDPELAGGVLCDSISRKTLFDLNTLLNASFPDYDFTDAKGDSFHRVPSLELAVSQINTQLSSWVPNYQKERTNMWRIVNDEIKINECVVYSYNPDYQSDPFGEDGCIWSFNYFFVNKCLKRILFFTCRAISLRGGEESEDLWNMDQSS